MLNWIIKWGIVASGLSAAYFWKQANPGKSLNPFAGDFDRGTACKWLQHALNLAGARPQLRVDGNCGPKTRRQLALFQQRWGLAPDGKPTPQTIAALRDAILQLKRNMRQAQVHCGFGAET